MGSILIRALNEYRVPRYSLRGEAIGLIASPLRHVRDSLIPPPPRADALARPTRRRARHQLFGGRGDSIIEHSAFKVPFHCYR